MSTVSLPSKNKTESGHQVSPPSPEVAAARRLTQAYVDKNEADLNRILAMGESAQEASAASALSVKLVAQEDFPPPYDYVPSVPARTETPPPPYDDAPSESAGPQLYTVRRALNPPYVPFVPARAETPPPSYYDVPSEHQEVGQPAGPQFRQVGASVVPPQVTRALPMVDFKNLQLPQEAERALGALKGCEITGPKGPSLLERGKLYFNRDENTKLFTQALLHAFTESRLRASLESTLLTAAARDELMQKVRSSPALLRKLYDLDEWVSFREKYMKLHPAASDRAEISQLDPLVWDLSQATHRDLLTAALADVNAVLEHGAEHLWELCSNNLMELGDRWHYQHPPMVDDALLDAAHRLGDDLAKGFAMNCWEKLVSRVGYLEARKILHEAQMKHGNLFLRSFSEDFMLLIMGINSRY